MLYINDSCTDPHWNLAAEEYLLKNFSEPVFRLWRNEDSIIIGHYQNAYAEMDIDYVKRNGIKVVRRLTGGGAVFHDLGNLNFTFVEQRRPGEDASAMFRRFTAPILDALNHIGTKAYLEGRNDLLIEGRKFSGNAVCIHKERILQHGTLLYSASMGSLGAALKSRPEKFIGKAVQSNRSRVTNISEHLHPDKFPPGISISNIEDFRNYLAEFICSRYPDIRPYEYTPEDLREIGELVAGRYSRESWNLGSSPNYSFQKVSRLPGGILELYMSVGKGAIVQLEIMGDYFFTLPTEEFCSRMIGAVHTPEGIMERLREIGDIPAYFNNVTIEELHGMFFNWNNSLGILT